MQERERTCPACDGAIEAGETVVFFEGEMYHVRCAPGATPPPRTPRFD